MCIKYFTTLAVPISFTELATDEYKTPKAMIEAEEFEQKMLRDVLRFKVYRETLYEAIDKSGKVMPERKLRDLILAYGTMKSREVDLYQLLSEFE